MAELSFVNLTQQASRHWPAYLALGFDCQHGHTRMRHMEFRGPLRVQRPFYPEGGLCHIYLLHPPGGLVSGDDLTIRLNCQPGSATLVTTPSAGKIYRADSEDGVQKQDVEIEVDTASCEWLPMETIVFDGAHGKLATTVHLQGDARFIGLDVFCLGRPKSQLPFVSGSVEQRFSLYHQGRPLLLERQYLAADDPLLSASSGYGGHLVSGMLVAVGMADPQSVVEQLREQFPAVEQRHLSITFRLDVLVVRYLGDCSEQAQQQLRHCWQIIRPAVIGRDPCCPRIWNT